MAVGLFKVKIIQGKDGFVAYANDRSECMPAKRS